MKRQRKIASIYRGKLDDMIKHPQENDERKHAYLGYEIRTPYNPSMIIEKMSKRNIICESMYVPPLHMRTVIRKFDSTKVFNKTTRP